MEDHRSKSYGADGGMQVSSYYTGGGPPPNSTNFVAYSASRARGREQQLKKRKFESGSSSKGWGFMGDPDFQRKKRVVRYKSYSVKGRVKGSLGKSFRWFKHKYTQAVYGWW